MLYTKQISLINTFRIKTKNNEKVIDLILKEYNEAGYNVKICKLNAAEYGVPQSRIRVIFIGIRKDIEFIEEKENKLFNRKEIKFYVDYDGEATPKVLDIKSKLVALLNTKKDVIVVDNGSTDSSVALLRNEFPQVKLIEFSENYGFAEGYNQALKKIDNEYYVLLNSDVRTPMDWLYPLVEYMEQHPECAACQPKILSEHEPEKFEYAGAAGGFIDSYGYPFCRGRAW